MLFGGALASTGFVGEGRELSLLWVGLAGTAGNLVGSWIAYGVGAWGGRPLLDRFGRYLLIRPHEIDKAHDWFERHGDAAVFFSRLLPVIRTFISVPAGVARMNFAKFTLYTILGCLPWTFALAWMGYALGDNWTAAEKVIRPVAWAIAVLVRQDAIRGIRPADARRLRLGRGGIVGHAEMRRYVAIIRAQQLVDRVPFVVEQELCAELPATQENADRKRDRQQCEPRDA